MHLEVHPPALAFACHLQAVVCPIDNAIHGFVVHVVMIDDICQGIGLRGVVLEIFRLFEHEISVLDAVGHELRHGDEFRQLLQPLLAVGHASCFLAHAVNLDFLGGLGV